MPSGPKKRKAAKKKKDKEIHNPSTKNPQGNDDMKSQDGKESDDGEVSSPVSRDQDSDQNPFNEGSEELGERDSSSIRPYVAEERTMLGVHSDVEGAQKIGLEDDGVVVIERELKSEENSESKNVSIEHVEFAKESHDGDERSFSSSSPDDKPQITEEKPNEVAYNSVLEARSYDDLDKPVDSSQVEVIWVADDGLAGETFNSIPESATLVDSLQSVVPVSQETIEMAPSAPVENPVIMNVVEVSEESREGPAAVTDFSLKKSEEVFPLSYENVQASSNMVESVSNGYESKILPSSSAPVAATSNDAAHVKDSVIPECSESQPIEAPAPKVVQRTSWLCCCGLFEVLAGFGR
ncbi:uncharacterized protein LOC121267653 [Juglans microcarpa x Juglans regia]|uniref:uncharacterized protein LOC121267653 n=1 Tax=Juglans microcarpa x Juglans regia TaxID=2249226 RepID=UPI001B7EAAFA|nr:uncharacterized protein LOC121267653 [Juglans microcarpa x Juglans regia]